MKRAEAAALARAAKQRPLAERFWSKVNIQGKDECWLWLAATRGSTPQQAYGAFWLNGRHQPASRVALLLSGATVPDGMEACHRCDNPSCCNPAHLFVGTSQANVDDKVSKGRQVKGAAVHTAKLTDAKVAEIRAAKPPGRRAPNGLPAQLAAKYGVTKQHLSDIWAGKVWRET